MLFNTLAGTQSSSMLTTGIRIKKLRELRGYSQSYMACKLGISQEQYSYLETKQKCIPASQLSIIARLLGVKEELLNTFDPDQVLDKSSGENQNQHSEISELIIGNHENERRKFLELIGRLTEEIKALKKKVNIL